MSYRNMKRNKGDGSRKKQGEESELGQKAGDAR
jgi:hypothetical protein